MPPLTIPATFSFDVGSVDPRPTLLVDASTVKLVGLDNLDKSRALDILSTF